MIGEVLNILPSFFVTLLTVLLLSTSGFTQDPEPAADTAPSGIAGEISAASPVLGIDQDVLNQLSEDEQEWYKRFQEGVMFFDGWSEISQEILASFPAEQLAEKKVMVQRLGVKIGTEWAKDNDVRKVDNSMLKAWGERLHDSVDQGPDMITQTLQEIEQEVDTLLKSEEKLTQISPQS